MSGFVIVSLHAKYLEAFKNEIPALVSRGEIKYKEDKTFGLEHSAQALVDVMTGKNNGKKVIVLADS